MRFQRRTPSSNSNVVTGRNNSAGAEEWAGVVWFYFSDLCDPSDASTRLTLCVPLSHEMYETLSVPLITVLSVRSASILDWFSILRPAI